MYNTIKTSKGRQQVLNYFFILTLFYPIKGLFNIPFFVFIGDSSAFYFNKLYFILLFLFLIMLTIVNRLSFNKHDKLHILITFIVCFFALKNGNIELNRVVLMLFVLPILFQIFDQIGDNIFNYCIKLFFMFSLLYMFFEQILLQIRVDGELLISQNDYASFYKIVSANGETIDYRHTSFNVVRSGGFLADPLAMPVIVTMSAMYFYLYYKIYKKHLLFNILGMFLVISSLSTTAIISYVILIVIIETYYRRNLLMKILVSGILSPLIFYHPYFDYLIIRVTTNFSDEKYMNVFFNYDNMITLYGFKSLIFGEWVWFTRNVSSHLDIFLVVNAIGIVFSLYIYHRIFFKGIYLHAKHRNIYSIYSFMLLIPFISLYHHAMTLNTNVFIIVILISNRVIKPSKSFALNKDAESFKAK
jgi:hypothetical protein